MNIDSLQELLIAVQQGKLPIAQALEKLKSLPFEDLDFAKVDHHRLLRSGYAEVIYCVDKTFEHIKTIIETMCAHDSNVMGTRASPELIHFLKPLFPRLTYYEQARIFTVQQKSTTPIPGKILILTAGTSDIPIAEEARVTATFLGGTVDCVHDVGVAGIHRLFSVLDKLHSASVIIAIAGMEGALASVVAGLVDVPVIAVPTSVGYGAHFEGLAALLSMINSCAPGVSVVNIDNGFGAGVLATRILRGTNNKE